MDYLIGIALVLAASEKFLKGIAQVILAVKSKDRRK